MKKQELSDTLKIYYKGELIRDNLSFEECTEVLDELAQMTYDEKVHKSEDIQVEMTDNG